MGNVKPGRDRIYNSQYLLKLNHRGTRTQDRMTNVDIAFHNQNKIKTRILAALRSSFPQSYQTKKEFIKIVQLIIKAKNRELISTFTLLELEKDFLDTIKKEKNPMLLLKLDSSQFSRDTLSKDRNNLFWKIVQTFDYSVAKKYHSRMKKLFELTCKDQDVKKMTFEDLLKIMVNVSDDQLTPLSPNSEYYIDAKLILNEILFGSKCLGKFLSKIMYNFCNEGEEECSRTEDIFAMCILFNSLLRTKFAFYCYVLYLSRVLILKSKKLWLKQRQEVKANLTAFDDLSYMSKFLKEEEALTTVRSNSVQLMRLTSESRNFGFFKQVAPKNLHTYLKDSVILGAEDTDFDKKNQSERTRGSDEINDIELSDTPEEKSQIDMCEFLVHLNLHLKMNLDYVFSSNLTEILKFFMNLEDFMEKTFGNKELEIKIDMMRLVIRMTNATVFINKIVLLDIMNIAFLSYWQTFSLFTQVLLSELRTFGLKPLRTKGTDIWDE